MFPCVCMCRGAWAGTDVPRCMWAWLWRPERDCNSLSPLLSTCFLRWNLSLNLKWQVRLDKLPSELQGCSYPCLCTAGYRHTSLYLSFYTDVGDQTQVPQGGKHFIAYFPSLRSRRSFQVPQRVPKFSQPRFEVFGATGGGMEDWVFEGLPPPDRHLSPHLCLRDQPCHLPSGVGVNSHILRT